MTALVDGCWSMRRQGFRVREQSCRTERCRDQSCHVESYRAESCREQSESCRDPNCQNWRAERESCRENKLKDAMETLPEEDHVHEIRAAVPWTKWIFRTEQTTES